MLQRTLSIVAIIGLCVGAAKAQEAETPQIVPKPAAASGSPSSAATPQIQLAILLDSSSSMGGLIRQAQTHLWKIVNEFVLANRGDRKAEVTVALYEYGKNTLPASSKYVRRIMEFSDDLDKASQELMALKANTISGGDEWCGAAITAAVEQLAWSASNDDLKVICIAGNEPFSQGPIDFRQACRTAISKGIIVNTIYCGPHSTGASSGWQEGARLSDGSYTAIDQNRRTVRFAAPQDTEIQRLGVELNRTYVPYGAAGQQGQVRQVEQDRGASRRSSESSTQRAITKGNRLYRNWTWDLVDAVRFNKVELSKLQKEELPPALQEMKPDERKKYLDAKLAERQKIQTRIQELNAKRKVHIEKARESAASNSFDKAIIDALREQAKKKRIQLDDGDRKDGKLNEGEGAEPDEAKKNETSKPDAANKRSQQKEASSDSERQDAAESSPPKSSPPKPPPQSRRVDGVKTQDAPPVKRPPANRSRRESDAAQETSVDRRV